MLYLVVGKLKCLEYYKCNAQSVGLDLGSWYNVCTESRDLALCCLWCVVHGVWCTHQFSDAQIVNEVCTCVSMLYDVDMMLYNAKQWVLVSIRSQVMMHNCYHKVSDSHKVFYQFLIMVTHDLLITKCHYWY